MERLQRVDRLLRKPCRVLQRLADILRLQIRIGLRTGVQAPTARNRPQDQARLPRLEIAPKLLKKLVAWREAAARKSLDSSAELKSRK